MLGDPLDRLALSRDALTNDRLQLVPVRADRSPRPTVADVLHEAARQIAQHAVQDFEVGRESHECDFKSQISNLKSQISNLKSQISNLKSQISNLRFPIPA